MTRSTGRPSILPLLGLALGGALIVGCGKTGPAVPPAPRGPLPPALLEVSQRGDLTIISARVAAPRGENAAQQPVRVDLFRIDFPPGVEAKAAVDAFQRRGVRVAEITGDPLDPSTRLELADATTSAPADRELAASYVYAIRAIDRRGRSSPLIVGPAISPRPDRPAPELSARPVPDGIELRWQRGAEEARPVHVYRSSVDAAEARARRVTVEPSQSGRLVDSDVTIGTRYRYFARRVLVDEAPLLEGSSGAPIEVTARDLFAPSPPGDLVAVQEGAAVRLFWSPSPEDDVAAYRVYRRAGGSGDWQRLGESEQPSWLDREVVVGELYAYRVTTRDAAATINESEPSSEVELTVVAEPVTGGREGGR